MLLPKGTNDLDVDHAAYHLVSAFIGTFRVFDPGAATWVLQWTGGLPQTVPYRGKLIRRYIPARLAGTVLFSEALHRDLAFTVGLRSGMDFGEVEWPNVSLEPPAVSHEMVAILQTGTGPFRIRTIATLRFFGEMPGLNVALEVEYENTFE